MLAVLPAVIPSTTLCVIKPLTRLHREGHISAKLKLEYLVSRQHVQWADVVVFCRNTEPANCHALEWALQMGKAVIYELDDDLLDLPSNLIESQYHRNLELQAQLSRYLESADLIRVYSKRLKQKLDPLNAHVRHVSGPVDWSLVPAHSQVASSPSSRPIRIVYATSRITDHLANLFLDDLEELLRAYPDRLRVFMWGFRAERLVSHPAVQFLRYEANYDRFFHKFARSGFDIGLAPLPLDDFYLSKSNNKFREYAACRIAGVYSNVEVYGECVKPDVTGLLVENTRGAWFHALERLVLDSDLRLHIQDQAQQFARKHYSQEQFCNIWLEQVQSVLASRNARHKVVSLLPQTTVILTQTKESRGLRDQFATLAATINRLVRLVNRVVVNTRKRGIKTTILMARWAFNDLSLLFWRK